MLREFRLAGPAQAPHPVTVMIKKFANDFKEFAFKGNLIDMAVGIVIGGAFGTVVKSLVEDIFMPVIGYFTGGVDFSDKDATAWKTFPPGKPSRTRLRPAKWYW